MNKLPKIVHIIWVGTQQPMSTEKLLVVKKWSDKLHAYPDFKVRLWVDLKSSTKKSLDEIIDCYRKNGLSAENIEFVDISLLGSINHECSIAYECARHEIDRMESNFGNASDILRYIILSQLGGAYFDIDIEPHDIDSFVKIFKDYERPVLYVGTDSQTPYISDSIKIHSYLIAEMFKSFLQIYRTPDFLETWRTQFDIHIETMLSQAVESSRFLQESKETADVARALKQTIETKKTDFLRNPVNFYRFVAEKCSNDMFIATAQNPIMLDIFRRVIRNYTTQLQSVNNKTPGKLLSPENQRKVAVKFCYSGWNKMLRAIPITGPDAVREAIINQNPDSLSDIRTIRGCEGDFVNTYPAALTWLRSFTKFCKTPEELLQSCVEDLIFEASHLGILRLDDYLFILRKSLQDIGITNTNEYIEIFLKQLKISLQTSDVRNLVLQNTHTDFGIDLKHFQQKYKTLPADIDTIINCLFMEDDFAQQTIQADYVPKGNDNKINALNSLVHQIFLAANFIRFSPYFDITTGRLCELRTSKKDPFAAIFDLMLRIDRALNFLANVKVIHDMLSFECFEKQKHEINTLVEAISLRLAYCLTNLHVEFNSILSKLSEKHDGIDANTFSQAKKIHRELFDETSAMRLAARLDVQLHPNEFEEFTRKFQALSAADSGKRLLF